MTLALLSSVGFAQSKPHYKELPNYNKVSDKLYRGGQPLSGGIKKLAELGVQTIINLRGEDDKTRAEQKEAEAAGLRYFSVALPGLTRPDDKQIARVMEIIDAPENGTVFIHCKRGSDRTGTVVAIYRITHEDWTAERATSEARQHGMSWIEFGMKDYISDYYLRHKSGPQPQGLREKMERLPDLVLSYGERSMRILKRAGNALKGVN
jgi:protein tyrosine/serine phosphatase